MSKMNEFVGNQLTHASFLQMSQEIYAQILVTTPAALKLETIAPQYNDAITRLSKLIRRQTGYAETSDVSRADANRDALWNAAYYTVHYLEALSTDHALAPHVRLLAPLFSAYKGIGAHELTKETSEIEGFLAAIGTTENRAAATALGLLPLLDAISDENDKLKTGVSTRSSAAATRAAGTGTESTDEVRRQTVTAYRAAVARVNAVAELESTAAVTAFIDQANAIAAHYRTVMENQAKHPSAKADAADADAADADEPNKL